MKALNMPLTSTKISLCLIMCIITCRRTMAMYQRPPGVTNIYVNGMQKTTEEVVAMFVLPLRASPPPLNKTPIDDARIARAQAQAQAQVSLKQKAQEQAHIAQELEQIKKEQARIAQEQAVIAQMLAQERETLTRMAQEQAHTAHAQARIAEEQTRTALALAHITSNLTPHTHPAAPALSPHLLGARINQAENNEEKNSESDTDEWEKI